MLLDIEFVSDFSHLLLQSKEQFLTPMRTIQYAIKYNYIYP